MTDAELLALFENLYPDNNSREISEKDLRDGLEALLLSLSQRLGQLDDLTTPVATTIVQAINSIQSQLNNLATPTVEYGTDNPNLTPPDNYDVGTLYAQQEIIGETIEVIAIWMFSAIQGIGWFKLIDENGFLSGIQVVYKSASSVFDLPALSKNESICYRFNDVNDTVGDYTKTGIIGGTSGVSISHDTWVIALENSTGGDWSANGHKYLIVNNKSGEQKILSFATIALFPPEGEPNVIYIALDTGLTYYWNLELEDYQVLGNAVYGTYIDSTVFLDEFGDPVTPSGSQLYIDTTTNKIYRWDGNNFVLMAGGSGGSGTPNFAYLNDQQYVKYSEATGRLESGKISETPAGIDVNGNIKAQAVELENEPGTPANNTITRTGNQLKHTDETGATRNIATDVQVYKTISGNVTLDDSYHNAICWITANAIITVPSTLRADFNCVFDAIGTVAGTFTEGAGVTFSAPNGKILKDNMMCTLAKRTTSSYRLNGGLSVS